MFDQTDLHQIARLLNSDDLSQELNEKVNNTKDIINARVKSIGYSCRKIIGQDDLDFKIYSDQDCKLVSMEMEGSQTLNMSFPYNDIIYNDEINQWKMLCAQMYFRIYYNLIPNCTYTKTTFPNIFNIKRSNGKIQKARVKKNTGFRISKTKIEEDTIPTHKIPKLYVRAEFNLCEVGLEDYSAPKEYYKDIPIEDIKQFNPDIKEFEISFSLPDYLCYNFNGYKYNVVKYYHELHDDWCKYTLQPLIHYIKSKYDINIKINTHII